MKYIKGLDTIRALAVFFVIVDRFHWGPSFDQYPSLALVKNSLIPDGRFGVTLFFVLSGFLITSILLHERNKQSANSDKNSTIIKNFFIRRAFRIFPIYYLLIIVCCLCNYQYVKDHLLYFLTYTSNMIPNVIYNNPLLHTWSLAVEEQFYIVWPWFIIFVNRKYLKYVFITAIGIGIAGKFMELYLYHSLPFLSLSCFDAFGIGGFYAFMRSGKEQEMKFEHNFKIALPLLLFLAWKMTPFAGVPIIVVFKMVLDSLIALAIIMYTINNRSKLLQRYFFENRILNFFGKISYGLYLYHFVLGPAYDTFITAFAKSHSLPSFVTGFYFSYAVKLSLLTAVCWLSYKLIEQPVMNFKKKFAYSGITA